MVSWGIIIWILCYIYFLNTYNKHNRLGKNSIVNVLAAILMEFVKDKHCTYCKSNNLIWKISIKRVKTYYNINIRLFSLHGTVNLQVKQVMHVLLAQPTLLACLQKSYGQ